MGEGIKEAMTERVYIPRWLLLVLISIILSVFLFNREWGGYSKQVEYNTKQIEIIVTTKAEKSELNEMKMNTKSIEVFQLTKADKSELIDLKKLIDSKVDKSEFKQLDRHLNKIEDLILQHMQNND